jgi:hypothetical protein
MPSVLGKLGIINSYISWELKDPHIELSRLPKNNDFTNWCGVAFTAHNN